MNPIKITLWLILTATLISCNTSPKKLDFNSLLHEYSENGDNKAQLSALNFFHSNIQNQVSLRRDSTGQLSTISDTLILTNGLLKKNIDDAIKNWNNWPGNKNEAVFLNYVLPYKVSDEYPEDWRSEVHKKYVTVFSNSVENVKILSFEGNVQTTNKS